MDSMKLKSLPLKQLTRLVNTGMMPMPLKKDGTYDLETSETIHRWVRNGYKN